MKNHFSVLLTFFLLFSCSSPQKEKMTDTSWPDIKTEAKPGSRWWILGSAADEKNLTYNLEEYAKAGLGTLEITPIYGVQNNEKNDVDYLSPRWMELYKYTVKEARRLGIDIEMNNGTGWPFGGPEVTKENAATKVVFQEYALEGGETLNRKIIVEKNIKPKPGQKQQPIKQKDPDAVFDKLMVYSDDGSQKMDISRHVVEDGTLKWTAPEGKWKLIAVFNSKTNQNVKRAAPGGEGLVIDHFSKTAVDTYLSKFDRAFTENDAPFPTVFFNDSYEVYGADWTPNLFDEFYKRRGYRLQDRLPEFLNTDKNDITARIVSDYRETLAELLLENFTENWTDWAHSHGSMTRNQAHGSPANLIDQYAVVDIPECEGYGMTDFNIKGLRKDVFKRSNDSDLSMMKYASSAAHISGKRFTSSETLTWLTEHFRTSLSQCKPDIDLMFAAGVNHLFFHGTPYSPKEAAWPGWKFYASINMSPSNPNLWRDASELFSYIARCQSFLQMGEPDCDFLVYLPVYDMWFEQRDSRFLQFDIHNMKKRAPKFIHTISQINAEGYDVDYISDNFIRNTSVENGLLKTPGGTTYKAVVVPSVSIMPEDVLAKLIKLARRGAKVVFIEKYPESVPGFANLEKRMDAFHKTLKKLPVTTSFENTSVTGCGKGQIITGSKYNEVLGACKVIPEEIKSKYGAHIIRRKNNTGYHYFISSLQNKGIEGWITLGVPTKSAMIFDPMTGKSGLAKIRKKDTEGTTQIYLQIASGQSVIIKTYTNDMATAEPWNYYIDCTESTKKALSLNNDWRLSFIESDPEINGSFNVKKLLSWTDLNIPDAKINRGVGVYTTTFTIPDMKADQWVLDLGDVRESARVRINGKYVATLWAVPYKTYIGEYLKKGENTIEIEVVNLPANIIADYDRRGIPFRIFKDANISSLYGNKTYAEWETVPSGLLGPVTVTPVDKVMF